MYQLIPLFTSAIFAQASIPFNPIYPINVSTSGRYVDIQWEILEEGYEYKVEILKRSKCNNIVMSLAYIQGNTRGVYLDRSTHYCWRLKYRLIGTTDYSISDLYHFTHTYYVTYTVKPPEEEVPVIEDIPAEEEPIVTEEEPIVVEDIPETEVPVEEVELPVVEESAPSVDTPSNEETVGIADDIDTNSDIKEETVTEVLGEKTVEKEDVQIEKTPSAQCSLIYDKRSKKYIKRDCTLKFPDITEIKKYSIDGDYDYVLIKGNIQKQLNVEVTVIDCKKFSLFKPSTWFKCDEVSEKGDISANLIYSPNVKISGKRSTISTYDIQKDSFLLKIFSEKLNHEDIFLTFDIYFYININGTWLDFRDTIEKKFSYSTGTVISGNRPLRYVFENITGVTQWHGYTEYASPHPGIDFGAVKEKILSPADGIIYDIGWDNYYGKCNSGGKYLKIKHTNGMYTVYMHLESYINEKGKTWNIGDKIKKGQQVGISGNTGAYNCQSLGYHLHYELRKNSQQSSHTNPVPYTDIDWDLIPTINWQTYPGRLSGDNPHPNF